MHAILQGYYTLHHSTWYKHAPNNIPYDQPHSTQLKHCSACLNTRVCQLTKASSPLERPFDSLRALVAAASS